MPTVWAVRKTSRSPPNSTVWLRLRVSTWSATVGFGRTSTLMKRRRLQRRRTAVAARRSNCPILSCRASPIKWEMCLNTAKKVPLFLLRSPYLFSNWSSCISLVILTSFFCPSDNISLTPAILAFALPLCQWPSFLRTQVLLFLLPTLAFFFP